MRFTGTYLNNLLELQGDGRPLDEDRWYMLEYPSYKFIPMDEFFKKYSFKDIDWDSSATETIDLRDS